MMLAIVSRTLPAVVAGLLVCDLAGIAAMGQGRAAPITVTNLLSLRQSLQASPGAAVSLSIEGTICAVSASRGALIIQDASQTDLLLGSGLPVSLAAGQRVRLTATHCQARWQRQGVALPSVLPGDCRSFVLQDATRGIFIHATNLASGQCPQLGEFWQIEGAWNHEFFLMDGSTGLRFIAGDANDLSLGDHVEVAGYPELGRPSPMLHHAVLRRTGTAPLPAPKRLLPGSLLQVENDSNRPAFTSVAPIRNTWQGQAASS